jgi:tetratricopeptide (TPR) repeat protein
VNPVRAQAECERLVQDVYDAPQGSDARLAALLTVAEHRCARHSVSLSDIWAEASSIHATNARWDEAIEAWERAIAQGYRAVPHPRAEIAELLVRAGRLADAAALYERLREQCPDDPWLRNSAGWVYAKIGDDDTSVRWTTEGLRLVLDSGDPSDLVTQLAEMRADALRRLGRPVDDDIAREAAGFVRPASAGSSWSPSPSQSFGEVEPNLDDCEHCGWTNELSTLRWVPTSSELPRIAPPVVKVGRNEPCPCESGRKFKKCCGA